MVSPESLPCAPLTVEAFMAAYEGQPGRFELLDGRVVGEGVKPMNPVRFFHFETVSRLIVLLEAWCRAGAGGRAGPEMGFLLGRQPDTVLAPDVAWLDVEQVAQAREQAQSHGGFPEMAPALAVEVLSASDRAGPIARKVQLYLTHGSRMVWIIDPQQRAVVVHRAGQAPETLVMGQRLEADPELPGFTCAVADLFDV